MKLYKVDFNNDVYWSEKFHETIAICDNIKNCNEVIEKYIEENSLYIDFDYSENFCWIDFEFSIKIININELLKYYHMNGEDITNEIEIYKTTNVFLNKEDYIKKIKNDLKEI